MNKEKIFKILTILFAILTIVGSIYIFINRGQANAGYALTPCIFALVFSNMAVRERKKDENQNK